MPSDRTDDSPARPPEKPSADKNRETNSDNGRESSERGNQSHGRQDGGQKIEGRHSYDSGKADLSRSAWNELWNSLSEADRRLLQNDPHSRLEIITTASRLGSDTSNQQLTDARGEAARKVLTETYGVKGEIHVQSMGERSDRGGGGSDDAKNRIIQLMVGDAPPKPESHEIPPGNTPEVLADKLLDRAGVPNPGKKDNVPEFEKNSLEALKDGVGVVKDLDNPVALVKDVVNATWEGIKKLAESSDAAHQAGNFSMNTVVEFHIVFDKLTVGRVVGEYGEPMGARGAVSERQAREARRAVENGALLAESVVKHIDPEMKIAMQAYAADQQRWHSLHQALEKSLRARMGRSFGDGP